jgi:hypothetical protein
MPKRKNIYLITTKLPIGDKRYQMAVICIYSKFPSTVQTFSIAMPSIINQIRISGMKINHLATQGRLNVLRVLQGIIISVKFQHLVKIKTV